MQRLIEEQETEIINRLLSLHYDKKGVISTLAVALRGARELTGRDVETGELIEGKELQHLEQQVENLTYVSNKFIGLTVYLIIIDLVGDIFKRKGIPSSGDRYNRSLCHFSDLNQEEINSLKNLRNSLAHKFSLGNDTEIFILDYSGDSKDIIRSPEKSYNCSVRHKPKTTDNYATAYFYNICGLVEKIYTKLIELHEEGQLELLGKYKNERKLKFNHINSMFFIKG